MLQKLLGSHARAEILKNLFTLEHKTLHLRELSRLSNLSAPVLLRELRQLAALGLVNTQKDGNRTNFSAKTEHPLYSPLCELVAKTEGSIEILRTAFADIPAEFIFIFGSMANGTANLDSDIDLFVIGDCGLREVTRRIHVVAGEIRQEINPYVITRDDFLSRIQRHDHFLGEIRLTQKIFLKGDANEFARLVG